MIDEKTKIEHFDILLKNIDDIGNFNISLTLQKGIGIDTTEFENEKLEWFNKLHDAVQNFGTTHKYFEETYFVTYRLTEKGIKAKELGGHLKYQKSIKKTPLNLYQKIQLPFFILFGLFGIYKVFQPSVPVSDFQKLKTDFENTNLRLDSLIIENGQRKPPKTKSLNDTLQTNNSLDLKND